MYGELAEHAEHVFSAVFTVSRLDVVATSMFGKWLKPLKNDNEYSNPDPVWPHRRPVSRPSGSTDPASTIGIGAASAGTTVHRWFASGTRLGVKRGTQTASSVSFSICATPRTPVTARNPASTTLVKSRGAKRSVGLMMSALPHRMNCLPASTVNGPRVSVAVRRRMEARGLLALRSSRSRRHLSSTWSCELARRSSAPPSCIHGTGLKNTSSRSSRSPTARVGSLDACCGNRSPRPSTKPRPVSACADVSAHHSIRTPSYLEDKRDARHTKVIRHQRERGGRRMVTTLRLKPPSDDERSVRESSLPGGRCAAAKTASITTVFESPAA